MDFTLSEYSKLVRALKDSGYKTIFTGEAVKDTEGRSFVLRHDVDASPANSLATALIEKELGLRGIYYFRTVRASWDREEIEEIAGMGHEIGYHYEDLSLVTQGRRTKDKRLKEEEIVKHGIESFGRNLERFRKIVPVKSICMHGSPLSRWDSRLLWKYYDYKDFGIESEPYFDVSFEDRLYLTDTGRRWNGGSVSVRDRAESGERRAKGSSSASADEGGGSANSQLTTHNSQLFADWVRKPIPGSLMNMTLKAFEFQARYRYRHTKDITRAIEAGVLPGKLMMTFHPQRWTDNKLLWCRELVAQSLKNSIKYFLVKLKG